VLGQAALKQASRRADDLRAAAAGAEARERDSMAQVERANSIIERLTVRRSIACANTFSGFQPTKAQHLDQSAAQV
jgi:hypothetical protein